MKNNLVITTDFQHLGELLSSTSPDGVEVNYEPIVESRSFDVNITSNIDVSLVIDLTKITTTVAAAWLLKHLQRRVDFKIKINGKDWPRIEADAKKLLESEINQKENNNR